MSDEVVTDIRIELINEQVAMEETEKLHRQISRVNLLLMRSLSLVRRLSGGNEDIVDLVSKLQNAIYTVNMLRNAILMLQTTSGPAGWLLMGMGLFVTSLSIQEDIDNTFRSVNG